MADHVPGTLHRGCPLRNYLAAFGDDDDPGRKIPLAHLRDTRARMEALATRHKPDDPGLSDRTWVIVEGLYAAAGHPQSSQTVDAAVRLAKDTIEGHV